jgi:uncharacterized protein YqgV (UPF0045/DUF77 family)
MQTQQVLNTEKVSSCIPIRQNEKDTGLSVPISPEDSLGEVVDRAIAILTENNIAFKFSGGKLGQRSLFNNVILDGDSNHPFQFSTDGMFVIYNNYTDDIKQIIVDRDTVKLNCQTTPGHTLFEAITNVCLI